MMIVFILALSAIFLLLPNSWAACPEWLNHLQDLPYCPETGTTVLDNTYPAMAYFIGTGANDILGPTLGVDKVIAISENYVKELVSQILLHSEGRTPLIFIGQKKSLLGEEGLQSELKTFIENLARTHKKDPKSWLDHLVFIDPRVSNPWMRDFMQPIVNSETGEVGIGQLPGQFFEVDLNEKPQGTANSIAEEIHQACEKVNASYVFSRTTQPPEKREWDYGGNFLGLPGGLILHGEKMTDWDHYGAHIFKTSKDNEVIVPTSWLEVGHVDEIVSVVPKQGNPSDSPCNFAIVLANPEVAFKILREHPNERFFGTTATPDYRFEIRGFKALCELYKEKLKLQPGLCIQQDDLLPPTLTHLTEATQAATGMELLPPKDEGCESMTNQEVLNLLYGNQDHKLAMEKLAEAKKIINERLTARLPQCAPIDFIEVPELYFNEGRLASILPSQANLISVGKTAILPKAHHTGFAQYVEKELKDRGIPYARVDTFDQLHLGMGNLHCATNEVRVCRPRNQ